MAEFLIDEKNRFRKITLRLGYRTKRIGRDETDQKEGNRAN